MSTCWTVIGYYDDDDWMLSMVVEAPTPQAAIDKAFSETLEVDGADAAVAMVVVGVVPGVQQVMGPPDWKVVRGRG